MQLIAALPAALVSIACGLILGFIPVVQHHLYWVIIWLIPLSGLVYGFIVGLIAFSFLKICNCKATPAVLLLLVIAAALGHASIDVGRWLTEPGVNDAGEEIRAFQALTLPDYVIGVHSLGHQWDYAVAYVLQFFGAAAASWGALLVGVDENPYCDNCRRYKSKEGELEIYLNGEEAMAQKLFAEIQVFMDERDFLGLRQFTHELQAHSVTEQADLKIDVDERRCHSCEARTMFGGFSFLDDEDDWVENDDYKFSVTSDPNIRVS